MTESDRIPDHILLRYKQPWSAAKVFHRFWSKVDKGDGCWEWKAARDGDGYGLFTFPWGIFFAHRVSYELATAEPIPAGLVIDHLCRNKACVNPAHLELVTDRTNILRGSGLAAANAAKVVCSEGHPFDFIRSDGRRGCHKCDAARRRRYKAKLLGVIEVP